MRRGGWARVGVTRTSWVAWKAASARDGPVHLGLGPHQIAGREPAPGGRQHLRLRLELARPRPAAQRGHRARDVGRHLRRQHHQVGVDERLAGDVGVGLLDVVAQVGEEAGGALHRLGALRVRGAGEERAARDRHPQPAGRGPDLGEERARGAGVAQGSPRQGPASTSSRAAESRTERVITPSMASPDSSAPCSGPKLTRPRLALSAKSPQQEAGMRSEPPPSLPCAAGTMRAATAAAEPPEEPPGVCSRFQGLRQGPRASGSVTALIPNSGALVWPKSTRPAALSRWTTPLSSVGTTPARNREPPVTGCPAQAVTRSLSRKGTPESGPRAAARARGPGPRRRSAPPGR